MEGDKCLETVIVFLTYANMISWFYKMLSYNLYCLILEKILRRQGKVDRKADTDSKHSGSPISHGFASHSFSYPGSIMVQKY